MKHKIKGRITSEGEITLTEQTGIFDNSHVYYSNEHLHIEFPGPIPAYQASDLIYPDSYLKVTEGNGDVMVISSSDITKNGKSVIKNKQDKLVSGKSIKTINGESVLGGGDIDTTPPNATTKTAGTVILTGATGQELWDNSASYTTANGATIVMTVPQVRAMIAAALHRGNIKTAALTDLTDLTF